MKLYWFRNLVQYFPSWDTPYMKYDAHLNKTLVWPHDVESFQVSKFCLFVMVQLWNIGVCWIDQVFVTELTVVIFFVHAAVLSIENSISFGKIIFIIPYYTIDSVKRNVLSSIGFIYMLLTFKLLKLFRKPVALLCDISMLYL
jgi:hypothetical protein